MNNDDFIGNLSTIVKILVCIIAPSLAIWLGTDENTSIALLTAFVGLLFSLVDAKYQNSLFNNNSLPLDNEEDSDE